VRSPDTSPDADRKQREILASLSGARRIEIAFEMSASVREIAADGIRSRHPEYDETQVRHALHRLLLGDPLFRAAWPDAPLLAP
jgi:hypothetical protein